VRRLVVIVLVVGVTLLAATGCIEPTVSSVAVVSGLDHPWDIGFLPNGSMLVTERRGRLLHVVGGTPHLLAVPGDVFVKGEAGMLGLAVDPRFPTNGYVFVCMASTASGTADVRLVRYTVNQSGTQVLARKDVFTGMPVQSAIGRHAGCRPRFGPDGNLWVGTGDAAIGTNPQDVLSWGGKVLRLTREGAPAAGNPLGLPWWNYGHRNVQGIAFRRDGFGVSVEQGTDRDDEVNALAFAANGGWDPVPGYDETTPMTDFRKFPNAMTPIWASGFPTMATSGATFIEGPQWGSWNGALVIGTLKAHHLQVLLMNRRATVLGSRQVVSTFGRLRQPVQGPDGNLYVATDNGGDADMILKITPALMH
jgi:glucose/arabinose dehydrogenase